MLKSEEMRDGSIFFLPRCRRHLSSGIIHSLKRGKRKHCSALFFLSWWLKPPQSPLRLVQAFCRCVQMSTRLPVLLCWVQPAAPTQGIDMGTSVSGSRSLQYHGTDEERRRTQRWDGWKVSPYEGASERGFTQLNIRTTDV